LVGDGSYVGDLLAGRKQDRVCPGFLIESGHERLVEKELDALDGFPFGNINLRLGA
jgi:hypothetical protein